VVPLFSCAWLGLLTSAFACSALGERLGFGLRCRFGFRKEDLRKPICQFVKPRENIRRALFRLVHCNPFEETTLLPKYIP
jgi:hypothetical protein